MSHAVAVAETLHNHRLHRSAGFAVRAVKRHSVGRPEKSPTSLGARLLVRGPR